MIGRRLAAAALVALAVPGVAHAAHQSFARVGTVDIEAPGRLELRVWNDVDFTNVGYSDYDTIALGLGLAYGVTSRLELTFSPVLTQYYIDEDLYGYVWDRADLHVSLVQLGARYVLVEPTGAPVAVLVSGTLGRPTDPKRPFVADERVVVERRLGPIALSLNAAAREYLGHADMGVAFEIDGGLRIALSPTARVGAELGYGTMIGASKPWLPIYGGARPLLYGGYTVSFGTDRLWVDVFAGFGGEFGLLGHVMIGVTP